VDMVDSHEESDEGDGTCDVDTCMEAGVGPVGTVAVKAEV